MGRQELVFAVVIALLGVGCAVGAYLWLFSLETGAIKEQHRVSIKKTRAFFKRRRFLIPLVIVGAFVLGMAFAERDRLSSVLRGTAKIEEAASWLADAAAGLWRRMWEMIREVAERYSS